MGKEYVCTSKCRYLINWGFILKNPQFISISSHTKSTFLTWLVYFSDCLWELLTLKLNGWGNLELQLCISINYDYELIQLFFIIFTQMLLNEFFLWDELSKVIQFVCTHYALMRLNLLKENKFHCFLNVIYSQYYSVHVLIISWLQGLVNWNHIEIYLSLE